MTRAARPGRGGRQPHIDRGCVTEATAELRRELGSPHAVTDRGSLLQYWEVDPDGDGALVARLSGEEVRRGETAFGQVHELRRMAEYRELRPRWLLVGLRLSGSKVREYEARLSCSGQIRSV